MRKRVSVAVLAALLCLAAASSAAAATEFGDRCVGDATKANSTAIGAGNGEPFIDFPFDAGPDELRFGRGTVITRWKVEVGPGLAPLAQQLVSFKQLDAGVVRLLGESTVETLHEGTNEFATRIPAAEYGLIGLRGPDGALFCDEEERHILGLAEGAFPVGATGNYAFTYDRGVPAIARVERDEDGDGYGDETQDGCSVKPLFQGPCPVVSLWLPQQETLPGAVLISALINVTATVHAYASVVVPASNRELPPRVVPLDLGAQLVAGGTRATFRAPLPKVAIRRLAKMRPREKVQVKVTAIASDALELEGRTMTRERTLRIPGRLRVQHSR